MHSLRRLTGHLSRQYSSHFSTPPSWLRISPSVARALRDGAPVVALETAIVTHGLPRPTNHETALALEAEVRSSGAEPATVALLKGKVCVGLAPEELHHLAMHPRPEKVSRRDVARVLADQDAVGGTTVSGTLLAARAAGIPVFATGGIGGVHRGANETWDVSADLPELGRSPVCVVCAGAKSILDISRTLEVLETHGVCVLSLKTDFFPAFFAPSSGQRSPCRVDRPEDAAAVLASLLDCGLQSGMLLAVPIPDEVAADAAKVENAIQMALREADAAAISGREITPFVLQRVTELTDGVSLAANIALVRHNAKIAAEVAKELSRLRSVKTSSHPPTQVPSTSASIVVIGGSNVDIVCSTDSDAPLSNLASLAASYPGIVRQACGGVGRNVAEVLARLEITHRFLTAIGADAGGQFLRSSCPQISWNAALEREDLRTAHYVALLSTNGQLMFGVADMAIHQAIDVPYLQCQTDYMTSAAAVFCDANCSVEAMQQVVRSCTERSVPLWLDPTDVLKATKLLDAVSGPVFASPNLAELSAMLEDPRVGGKQFEEPWIERLNGCRDNHERRRVLLDIMRSCDLLSDHFRGLLVKLSHHGVLLWPEGLWYGVPTAHSIVSVSGAGDSFVGAFLAARYAHCLDIEVCLWAGLRAAYASLETHQTVSDKLQSQDFGSQELQAWARGLASEKF